MLWELAVSALFILLDTEPNVSRCGNGAITVLREHSGIGKRHGPVFSFGEVCNPAIGSFHRLKVPSARKFHLRATAERLKTS